MTTVGELINELQKYPLETPVFVYDSEYESYTHPQADLQDDRWDSSPEWPHRITKIKEQVVVIK